MNESIESGTSDVKQEQEFVNKLDLLNDDVLGIIWSKLPLSYRMRYERQLYIENHNIIRTQIRSGKYLPYLLDMINNDCAFVFEQILRERFMDFHCWKRYIHNGRIFPSFLLFLLDYACCKEATRCIMAFRDAANNNGFGANWYKSRASIIIAT